MIIPDTNLLIYAHHDFSPHHPAAKAWWADCLNNTTVIGLPWLVILGFLRLSTNRGFLQKPMKVELACDIVEYWLQFSQVSIISPGWRFRETFLQLLKTTGCAGNLTTDTFLAALAIEYQAELHSHDADFARFSGLRWINPLTVNR
jgi:toxin-antitoxin system PIN domain toxin